MNSQPIELADSNAHRDDDTRAAPSDEGRRPFHFQSLASNLNNPHLWLTLAMVAVGAILHYVDPSLAASEASLFDFSHRSMHRILFIVPVAYAGFIFGPGSGYATLLAVVAIMLPRAFLTAASPVDEFMEVVSIALVSGLILLWFSGQRRERTRRHEILSRLELARQELGSQVELIKRSEKRLAAINDVCCVVGQSLDLSPLLDRVMGKVVDNLGVDAALVFLKSGAGSQIELVAHRGICQETARAIGHAARGEGAERHRGSHRGADRPGRRGHPSRLLPAARHSGAAAGLPHRPPPLQGSHHRHPVRRPGYSAGFLARRSGAARGHREPGRHGHRERQALPGRPDLGGEVSGPVRERH